MDKFIHIVITDVRLKQNVMNKKVCGTGFTARHRGALMSYNRPK